MDSEMGLMTDQTVAPAATRHKPFRSDIKPNATSPSRKARPSTHLPAFDKEYTGSEGSTSPAATLDERDLPSPQSSQASHGSDSSAYDKSFGDNSIDDGMPGRVISAIVHHPDDETTVKDFKAYVEGMKTEENQYGDLDRLISDLKAKQEDARTKMDRARTNLDFWRKHGSQALADPQAAQPLLNILEELERQITTSLRGQLKDLKLPLKALAQMIKQQLSTQAFERSEINDIGKKLKIVEEFKITEITRHRDAYNTRKKANQPAYKRQRKDGYKYRKMRRERNAAKHEEKILAKSGGYPSESDPPSESSFEKDLSRHRSTGLFGSIGGFLSGKTALTDEMDRLGFRAGTTPTVFLKERIDDAGAPNGYYEERIECTLTAIDNSWLSAPQATIKMEDGKTLTIKSTKLLPRRVVSPEESSSSADSLPSTRSSTYTTSAGSPAGTSNRVSEVEAERKSLMDRVDIMQDRISRPLESRRSARRPTRRSSTWSSSRNHPRASRATSTRSADSHTRRLAATATARRRMIERLVRAEAKVSK